jgi:hypothetical protein
MKFVMLLIEKSFEPLNVVLVQLDDEQVMAQLEQALTGSHR